MIPTAQLAAQLPHAARLAALVQSLVETFDGIKAAGLPVPPVAAQGVASLGVALAIITGAEAEAAGELPEGESDGARLLAAITPEGKPAQLAPCPPADVPSLVRHRELLAAGERARGIALGHAAESVQRAAAQLRHPSTLGALVAPEQPAERGPFGLVP